MISKIVLDALAQYLVDNQAWFLGYREEIVKDDLKSVLEAFFNKPLNERAALLKDASKV